MRLDPGESTFVQVPLPLEVGQAVSRGAHLTFHHGPIFETSPRNYERMVELRLDGEKAGTFVLTWSSPPLVWYRRLWCWMRHKPAVSELRLGE